MPLLAVLDRIRIAPEGLDLTPRVLSALAAHGIRKPVQEHPVTWGAQDYVLDMAFVPERVDLELDDDWSHATAVGSQSDKERDRRARRAGWEVVRATPSTNLDELCDHLTWILARRARRRAA
jgi:hypothetical protein